MWKHYNMNDLISLEIFRKKRGESGGPFKSLKNIILNSVYDLYLDPPLNKLTVKSYFSDNEENLNMKLILDDIKQFLNFVMALWLC